MPEDIPFAAAYAGIYDHLYAGKDYGAECDLLESLFRAHGGRTERVLDLGCGTGSHAIPLARRGYRVAGVDRSPAMLAQARAKARAAGEVVDWYEGDVRDVRVGSRFDAALMMFAVLGYQLTNAHVAATLATARSHLVPGGLLVFDVWYGPAVLIQQPERRVAAVATPTGRIEREAQGTLDLDRQTCRVDFRFTIPDPDGGPGRQGHEVHRMRYFFPQELALFLDHAGFDLVQLGAFDAPDRPPGAADWNALAVARAR